ncbi:MAG: hypothetical protein LBS88_10350 [Tannerellaceae bacterium]|nr:hypothetical protein [Tannerellaceae bacterium]
MKMKFFLCFLCLAMTFGCDNHSAIMPGIGEIKHIGLEKDTLVFSGDASSVTLKTEVSGWGVGAFKSAYLSLFDTLSTLKENTTYMRTILGNDGKVNSIVNTLHETLSYEWIEASKTDGKALRVSVAENTSDTIRSIIIELSPDVLVKYECLFVTQHPKGQE